MNRSDALGGVGMPQSRRERRALALRERREARKRRRALRGLASGALSVGAVLGGADPVPGATFTVTNTDDAGPGSLRQAMIDANAAAGADEIVFALAPPATISLLSGTLPQVTGPLTITGMGAANLTIRKDPGAVGNFRIFDIVPAAAPAVTITGVTLTGGDPPGNGGAVRCQGGLTVTIADSVITGNQALNGGGIAVDAGAGGTSLTVQRTLIDGNESTSRGGGLSFFGNSFVLEDSTVTGNTSGDAGGGFYSFVPGGPVTIRGSTISGNTAAGFGGGGLSFVTFYSPPIVIENSTISGNAAALGGGGVDRTELLQPGRAGTGTSQITVTHSTITLNTTLGAFGAGGLSTTFFTTLRNTIVSGNTHANAPDIGGSAMVNFCAVGSPEGWFPEPGSGNNLPFGTDLQLGPLQDNGGPTLTHEPGPNAPPVQAGDPNFVPPPDFDQRGPGFARVIGGILDIGSVERDPVPVDVQGFTVE